MLYIVYFRTKIIKDDIRYGFNMRGNGFLLVPFYVTFATMNRNDVVILLLIVFTYSNLILGSALAKISDLPFFGWGHVLFCFIPSDISL